MIEHLLSGWLSYAFCIAVALASLFHIINQRRGNRHKLVSLGANRLADMQRQGERNMFYLCFIMLLMPLNHWGVLNGNGGWGIWLGGHMIVAVHVYIAIAAYLRWRSIYSQRSQSPAVEAVQVDWSKHELEKILAMAHETNERPDDVIRTAIYRYDNFVQSQLQKVGKGEHRG
jgi:hypothetical protein